MKHISMYAIGNTFAFALIWATTVEERFVSVFFVFYLAIFLMVCMSVIAVFSMRELAKNTGNGLVKSPIPPWLSPVLDFIMVSVLAFLGHNWCAALVFASALLGAVVQVKCRYELYSDGRGKNV